MKKPKKDRTAIEKIKARVKYLKRIGFVFISIDDSIYLSHRTK